MNEQPTTPKRDEKKGEVKRQHYVPRFVFRNFSKDAKSVPLIVLSSGRRVDEASIGRQCYEDYFYGEDNVMEKAFGEEETKIAGYLGDLSPTRLEALPFDPALYDVRQFVHYQRMRTKAAADEIEQRIDAVMKSIVGTTIDLNDDKLPFTRDDLDKVQLKLNSAPAEALWAAALGVAYLLDLHVKFIITDRTPGFVISDHPVVAYNQWAEHHPKFRSYSGTAALVAMGLQFFMPISPSVTIAVFDGVTYSYGSPKTTICKPGARDIRLLNEMQAINAESCLYFAPDRITDKEIERLRAARVQHEKMRVAKVVQSPVTPRGDGKLSNVMVVTGQDLKIGANLSFVHVNEHRSFKDYDLAMLPPRSEGLLALGEMWRQKLEGDVRRGVDTKKTSQE